MQPVVARSASTCARNFLSEFGDRSARPAAISSQHSQARLSLGDKSDFALNGLMDHHGLFAETSRARDCEVVSDGLRCFGGVTEAGWQGTHRGGPLAAFECRFSRRYELAAMIPASYGPGRGRNRCRIGCSIWLKLMPHHVVM
jgi:hypothetical protein